MLRLFGGKNAPDKTIVALPHVTKSEMLRGMARARYCPIFGGNSPWSTRLVEAMMARCVPVFFSSWLPPFSRVLDWSRFSVRVDSLDLVPRIKGLLEAQSYEALAANLPLALGALWYRVKGGHHGDDMLPFLMVEMQLALQAATAKPLDALAEDIIGLPLRLSAFHDDMLINRTSPLPARELPPKIAAAVHAARFSFRPWYRGGVTIVTNRSRRWPTPIVWRCVPTTKGSHSFRACDPWDEDGRNCSLVMHEMRTVQVKLCVLVHPKGLKSADYLLVDPLSPTQTPPNASLVAENVHWLASPEAAGLKGRCMWGACNARRGGSGRVG